MSTCASLTAGFNFFTTFPGLFRARVIHPLIGQGRFASSYPCPKGIHHPACPVNLYWLKKVMTLNYIISIDPDLWRNRKLFLADRSHGAAAAFCVPTIKKNPLGWKNESVLDNLQIWKSHSKLLVFLETVETNIWIRGQPVFWPLDWFWRNLQISEAASTYFTFKQFWQLNIGLQWQPYSQCFFRENDWYCCRHEQGSTNWKIPGVENMENIENIENMEKMENINQVSYRRLGGKCYFHWTRSTKALQTPPFVDF